jgi:hypothetical protein
LWKGHVNIYNGIRKNIKIDGVKVGTPIATCLVNEKHSKVHMEVST